MLSRFVALSVSLTQKASLFQYWQDCATAIRQEDSSISQVLEAAIDLCPKVDRPGPLIAAYGTQSTDVTLDFLQPETTYYIGVRAHAKDSPSLSLGTWGPGQGLSGASVEFWPRNEARPYRGMRCETGKARSRPPPAPTPTSSNTFFVETQRFTEFLHPRTEAANSPTEFRIDYGES